jgi:hypothetical protein
MVGLMIMRLILAIAFLALLAIPAQAQTKPCDQIVMFQHAAATGPVEIVPGIDGQRIYPCGFMLAQKGNTLDFQMWGAQDHCVGGPVLGATLFTPRMSLPTDVQLVNRIEHAGPSSQYGASICIQTWGTGGLTGAIYYAQF